jgi:hypothetical protein
MTDFVNDFAKMMAETQLQVILWQKIKKDWLEPGYDGQLYIDDKDNILAVNIDGSIALLGYLHIYHDLHKQPNFQNTILKSAAEFVSDLKNIAVQHDWKKGKVIIVTTYKLSNYDGMDFTILPDDVSYFYMTEFPEAEKKKYEMALDQEIIDFKAGDSMLKYFLDRGKKMNSLPEYWSCQICGGSNDTGCLYFDPTECPKFT